ncbi:hypothetical protein EMMF5_002375 [Cystobasidiomycetes sp. EMM_F5]
MFKSAALALALLASAVSGQNSSNTTSGNATILFTNPISGTQWTFSQNQTIQWTMPTASDPKNISLYVANTRNISLLPMYQTALALNIPSARQNFSLANVSLPIGDSYVILMTSITNASLIYAQGGLFNVTNSTSRPGSTGSGFALPNATTSGNAAFPGKGSGITL